MSEIKNIEVNWGPRPSHYEKEVMPEGRSVIQSENKELLGGMLIKETAKRLDVYHEKLSDAQLLDRVLDELGDEGVDDESTFTEKVERLDDILEELGEYPY